MLLTETHLMAQCNAMHTLSESESETSANYSCRFNALHFLEDFLIKISLVLMTNFRPCTSCTRAACDRSLHR